MSAVLLARAYDHCQRTARQHYENFPVASRLLPARVRPAVAAIYAFARSADDFADEPGVPGPDRLRHLDEWLARLRHVAGAPSPGPAASGADLVFLALGDTMRRHGLPLSLFEDLLSAFRQDVTTKRYGTWDDLLDYCRRSANPIGRLVLRVAGYRDAHLDGASDAVCTALQLTNFWQDLERDWAIGRLYVPADHYRAAGAREADLHARTITPAWRTALSSVSARTRELFTVGRPVCDGVHGRLRWELRLTWLGGVRVLDKLDAVQFDVFRHRPVLGVQDAAPLLLAALRWRRATAADTLQLRRVAGPRL
ncbi:MAG TPA: squalene synthase HpnC [Vicinamibacterales bacterium]|nr:squalene synthase HpnC [Vicinamibacterales bacterium]